MTWSCLLTVALGIHVVASANFKARLYSSGLEFLTHESDQVVEKALERITFPNSSYEQKLTIGKLYVVAAFDVEKAHFPKFEFFLSDDGITYVSQGGKMQLEGFWSAQYTFLFKVPTSGWIKADIPSIRVKLLTKVVAERNQPHVKLGQCVVELADANITVQELGIPWSTKVFNVRTKLQHMVKAIIREKICAVANIALKQKYSTYLSTVSLHMPTGLNSSIDYALEQLTYSRNFFDTIATATVAKQCSTKTTENWTEDDLVPKMAVFWLSQSVPQCLLESAHSRGAFDYRITKEAVSLAPFLKTSCSLSTYCIGRFFEKLRNEYPDDYVDLHLYTSKVPLVQVGGDLLTIVTSLAIDLHINTNRTDDKPLAKLELESTTLVSPKIVGNTLSGATSGIHNEFKITSSQIGTPSKALLALLGEAISETVTGMIDTIVQAAIPLPLFTSVALSDFKNVRNSFIDAKARPQLLSGDDLLAPFMHVPNFSISNPDPTSRLEVPEAYFSKALQLSKRQ